MMTDTCIQNMTSQIESSKCSQHVCMYENGIKKVTIDSIETTVRAPKRGVFDDV